MHRIKFSEILGLLIIAAYLIFSIVLGLGQYKELGELSNGFIVIQAIVLLVSVFLYFITQKSSEYPALYNFISTAAGGIAIMTVLLAVVFILIGDVIASEAGSTFKGILLGVIVLFAIVMVLKYLTKRLLH